ncbi:MAG: hypothetical protein ACE5IY_23945 [bacterium]
MRKTELEKHVGEVSQGETTASNDAKASALSGDAYQRIGLLSRDASGCCWCHSTQPVGDSTRYEHDPVHSL